jgi:hypothetical protein
MRGLYNSDGAGGRAMPWDGSDRWVMGCPVTKGCTPATAGATSTTRAKTNWWRMSQREDSQVHEFFVARSGSLRRPDCCANARRGSPYP